MPPLPDPQFDEIGNLGNDMGVLEDIEPEVVDGPMGLPVVKPKGLPDPPEVGGMGNPFNDY